MDRFRVVFEKSGVDYPVMRKILQVKLTMDGRRVPTLSNKGAKEKEGNNNFIRSLWIYALTGVFMIPFILMKNNYMFQMSIVFGIFVFMVMLLLISDFSSVLLDLRDKNTIMSKPVSNKTISTAKIIHIGVYLFFITAALAGIPLIVSLVAHGIFFFLIFLVEIIFADVFVVAFTALIYLLVLRVFDGEKLKDVINYVQVAMILVITVGYQLVGQLFSFRLADITFTQAWWQFLLLPVWFGAPFEVFLKGSTESSYLVLSGLAVAVPLISIMLYIRLMPAFERNLQKLNGSSGKKKRQIKIPDKIVKAFCPGKQERTFFRFTSDIMRSEREFKLKVYPSLGLSMAFPLIFLFKEYFTWTAGFQENSKAYFYLYFCALQIPTMIHMIKYSANYKGAWIYKAAPIKDMAPVYKGTIKALLIRIFLPVYLFDAIIFICVFGPGVIPNLVVILLNILLFTPICYKMLRPELPFSEIYSVEPGAGVLMFLPCLVLAVLGGIHFLCTLVWFGVYIDMAVIAAASIILWRKAFK